MPISQTEFGGTRVNNSRRRSLQSMSVIRRLNAEQRALVLGRQDVQKAIGTLPHVADALVQLLPKHRLAAKFLPFVIEVRRRWESSSD